MNIGLLKHTSPHTLAYIRACSLSTNGVSKAPETIEGQFTMKGREGESEGGREGGGQQMRCCLEKICKATEKRQVCSYMVAKLAAKPKQVVTKLLAGC